MVESFLCSCVSSPTAHSWLSVQPRHKSPKKQQIYKPTVIVMIKVVDGAALQYTRGAHTFLACGLLLQRLNQSDHINCWYPSLVLLFLNSIGALRLKKNSAVSLRKAGVLSCCQCCAWLWMCPTQQRTCCNK